MSLSVKTLSFTILFISLILLSLGLSIVIPFVPFDRQATTSDSKRVNAPPPACAVHTNIMYSRNTLVGWHGRGGTGVVRVNWRLFVSYRLVA